MELMIYYFYMYGFSITSYEQIKRTCLGCVQMIAILLFVGIHWIQVMPRSSFLLSILAKHSVSLHTETHRRVGTGSDLLGEELGRNI